MNRYISGSEKDFYNFINSISNKDKIGLVSHSDLDGIVSAVILNKILNSKGLNVKFLDFYKYSYDALKGILEENLDVLFFTDYAVDSYIEDLNKLRKNSKVLILDHHPLNPDLKDVSNVIKTKYDYCSSHTLFDLAKEIKGLNTKELEPLVCAAIITDYVWDKDLVNFDFIKSIYPDVKKDNSIFDSEPGNIGRRIDMAMMYYEPNYKVVYNSLLKGDLSKIEEASNLVDKEINLWVGKFRKEREYYPEKKLHFYYGNPKYNIASSVSTISSGNEFKGDTVVFASDILDKNGFVKFSTRNQSGEVNLGEILKKCSKDFENSDGGGHARAASATIMKKDLNKFKERFISEL